MRISDWSSDVCSSDLQHIITNHSCELDGNIAHAETYWLFAALDRNGRNLTIGGGRYVDRMEKRDGEWRIAARKCVPDWGGQPVETQISPEARAMLAQSGTRSEEHTSELQSLMRISYAVVCLKKKKNKLEKER